MKLHSSSWMRIIEMTQISHTYQLLVCLGPLPPIWDRFHVQLCSHHLRQFILLIHNWAAPRSAFQKKFATPVTAMIPGYLLVATQMLEIEAKHVNLQRRPSRIRDTGTGTTTILGIGFCMLTVQKWRQLCRIGGYLRRTQGIEWDWIHVYWNPAQSLHLCPQLSVEQPASKSFSWNLKLQGAGTSITRTTMGSETRFLNGNKFTKSLLGIGGYESS